jgi:hypothetical protein
LSALFLTFADNWVNMFQNNQLFQPFKPGDTIPKPELVSLLRAQYPDAKPATLDWHIYELVRQGLLARQGRGRYQLLPDKGSKVVFLPDIPAELGCWGKKLNEAFPFLTVCLWSTAALRPFMHQQPFVTYWLIETERQALNAVLDFVRVSQNRTAPAVGQHSDRLAETLPVVLAADLSLTERYQPDATTLVLVKPLISEAPIQTTADGLTVPTAEKILVDLLADTDVFNLFSEEVPGLFRAIDERYLLNIDRMRRYARRRHKLPVLDTHLACL